MAFGAASAASPASRAGLAVLRRVPAETAAQVRVWTRVLAVGLGVGALAGAGQLGIAYGLGLVRFARSFPTGGLWSAQLTWVAWFAALAALAGAVAGARAADRFGLARQLGGRILVAAGGGLGAVVVVPLTALPADSATLIGRTSTALPALEAALVALLGMVIGVLAAVAALTVRLVAVSLTLLVAAVWLLALLSVTPSLAPTAALPEVRLAVLDLPALGGAGSPAAVLSAPVLALLICGAVALAARSRGLPPLPTAVASTAAPGLLALVYLIGSPGAGDRSVQEAPYAGALLAVAAGLLVSLAVGVVRLPSSARDGDVSDSDLVPPPAGAEPPPGWPTTAGPAPLFPPPGRPAPAPEAPAAPAPERPAPPPVRPAPPPCPAPAVDPLAGSEPGRPAEQPAEPTEPDRPDALAAPEQPASPARPAKRPKLPRLGRKGGRKASSAEPPVPPAAPPAPVPPVPPAPPAPPDPPDPPEPSEPPATPSPSPRRRGRRRGEAEQDEHVDWINSLAGGAGPDEPDPGRRRLRPDRDDPDRPAPRRP